jgi:hypothetical protein
MLLTFLRGVVLATLTLCLNPAVAAEAEVTVPVFSQKASENEAPYISRVLLSKDYLRMDDSDDHGDFALFDRKDGTIYSVSHEDQRTLVIPLQSVAVAMPKPLRHDVEQLDAGGVPDVGGKKVGRYYLFTNGTRCMEIYAAQGFLEDAVSALAAFSRTLAGQHAKTISLIPEQIGSDCDLANNVFQPDRYLAKGFPVRQTDFTGKSRSLVNVKENVVVDSAIFALPEGYERFMPGTFSSN